MNWDDCLAQGQQSFSLRVLWLGALLAPCFGAMWNWTQIKLPFQVICLSNLIFCEGSDKWTWPCHKLKWSQLMSRDQMHEKNHAHNVNQKWKWEVNIESGNYFHLKSAFNCISSLFFVFAGKRAILRSADTFDRWQQYLPILSRLLFPVSTFCTLASFNYHEFVQCFTVFTSWIIVSMCPAWDR